MRTIVRLWLLLLALVAATMARADEVSQAGQGVVRIVVAVENENGELTVWTGSGFAVAPTRIVTNAHVVAPTYTAAGRTMIGVIPSNGRQRLTARVVGFDDEKDLALLEVTGARFRPLTVYAGALRDGSPISALGYPGNVDRMTDAAVIDPQTPMRTAGIFSSMRKALGIEGLLHTAGIARGNSGGPLVDACGRVAGVNTMVTGNDNGDTSFGFAISARELGGFLRRNGQGALSADTPCVTAEDQRRKAVEDDAKAELAKAKAEFERQLATAEAERKAAARIETERENRMALAAVLLVLAVLAGAYAMIALGKDRERPARIAAGLGVVLFLGAVLLFFTRPTVTDSPEPAPKPGPVDTASAAGDPVSATSSSASGTQALTCTIDPAASRIGASDPKPVELTFSATGCVNGRTQYAQSTAGDWLRVAVHRNENVIERLSFDSDARTLTHDKWRPDDDTMAATRTIKDSLVSQACTPDRAARDELATVQREVLGEVLRRPEERLVYRCAER